MEAFGTSLTLLDGLDSCQTQRRRLLTVLRSGTGWGRPRTPPACLALEAQKGLPATRAQGCLIGRVAHGRYVAVLQLAVVLALGRICTSKGSCVGGWSNSPSIVCASGVCASPEGGTASQGRADTHRVVENWSRGA